MNMKIDDIKTEFELGETIYIDAIESLQARGMPSKDAEALVSEWDEAMKLAAVKDAES